MLQLNQKSIIKGATLVITFALTALASHESTAQIVPVDSASYTLTFPGTDAAGRNGYPSGSPLTTGAAVGKPAPTNDWWSHKIMNNHSENLFNYPFTMKTQNDGLVVTYIPWGVIDDIEPLIVGVNGLNASAAKIADYSDWTVTMDWTNSGHHFTATSGIAMPFLYFTKDSSDVASIRVNQGSVTNNGEILIVEDVRNGADFAIYAPVGSTWSQSGNIYTSSLNGKNYWSLAFLPSNAVSASSAAADLQAYAYVFPQETSTSWSYDESTRVVTTDFSVNVDVKEGSNNNMLLGLLPHHWDNLSNAPSLESHTYATVRGEMKTLASNTFQVKNTFHGILPTLPYLDFYSDGFNPAALGNKVELLENDGLATWTDSYNEGQEMNRLIQTARIAQLTGDTEAFDKLLSTVKSRLQDWLQAQNGEVAFLFYYHAPWSAMLGYPAGHGQDNNINDHHFHWGYFIHAAAFVEQFEPGWTDHYGEMINLLVRDAASSNRNDSLFPFLRNFSPYAGHCWANGFASFPQGNDQESTSESMQFNSSLIHWGEVTGNDSIRDLGIYLYTTEQSAVEEYWFDIKERNFGPNQNYSLVSRVWGNSYDNGTFWTSDIAASYGIELYPIHGGSFYLGHDSLYAEHLWAEIEQNTGILVNEPNVNLWHDIMWEYLAFTDPQKAINLYDSYPDRSLKFGVSDAQTYHWLHGMNALGRVDTSIKANHSLAVVFNDGGFLTYVGQNYGNDSITINFSDGYNLIAPPHKLVTSRDINLKGVLSSSFEQAYPGGSVDLDLNISGGIASKVEFYLGSTLIGTSTQAPHSIVADSLQVGKHQVYARVYDGNEFNISNIITLIVGEQLPFFGEALAIPGSFDAAHYDVFEGGLGNGIAYQDMSPSNNGDFRTDQYVDANSTAQEGDVVGWISAGEWLEYTVDVDQAGYYDLSFRYACGNSAGGGPFYIYSDGIEASGAIAVNYTGDWDDWTTKTVGNVALKSGRQVLRIFFENGELNLGELTFSFSGPLNYSQPIANAGDNQLIVLPQNTGSLDASASSDPSGGTLNYEWKQVYGPSTLHFDDSSSATASFDTLIEGIYLLQLSVDNGSYTDIDEIYIISSTSNNVAPKVSISSPQDGSTFIEGESIAVSAYASDLNDSVTHVDLYIDQTKVGSSTQAPYEYTWTPQPGMYELMAVAFDGFGDSTLSAISHIEIEPAPPCRAPSWNGDFEYEFSDDVNNPTITFIPSQSGVGTPTCILYYGTDPGNMPGYGVTPNVPYQINASKGTRIYFYYTYSYPGVGERNNSANKDTYVVGNCVASGISEVEDLTVRYFPNPVSGQLHLMLPNEPLHVEVRSITGQLIDALDIRSDRLDYNMEGFESGIYIFTIVGEESIESFKVVKE